MIGFRRFAALALVLALGCFVPAPLGAEEATDPATPAQTDTADVLRRMAELEKEVERLRGELQAVKAVPSVSPALVPAVYNPQAAAPAAAASPEEKKQPGPLDGFVDVLGGATFTGFVDTYYGVNFDQPLVKGGNLFGANGHVSNMRIWDGMNNGLTLNMVNLVLDKAPDAKNSRVGYHVGLAFGNAMNVLNNAEPSSGGPGSSVVNLGHNHTGWDQYLMEAYFSYLAPVGKGLQIDVGKFVTFMGAEVVPTKDNYNYSRGLLYDFAIPLYHFGVRAKYTFNDKVNLTGFVLNGWNNVIDNNSGKSLGVSLGWNITKKLTLTQNYIAGPEQSDTSVVTGIFGSTGTANADTHWRQVSDTVLAYAVTPKLTLQTNFDYGRDTVDGAKDPVWWSGIANYVRYAFNPRNAFTVRHEYYTDPYGFTTGTAQHLHEITTTYERRFAGHLISRLEYRHDMSNRPVFLDHSTVDSLGNPVPTLKDQNTFTVGLMYVLQKSE